MPADPPSSDAIRAAIDAITPTWQSARHRLPVVISGASNWALSRGRMLVDTDTLWIGTGAPAGTPTLNFKRSREALGGECRQVIFNALDGLDPDALGAVAGLPRGGGRLVLLTPPLDQWPQLADPELARITAYPHTAWEARGVFVARLCRLLRACPQVWHLREGQPLPVPPRPTGGTPASSEPPEDACRTADQREAVDRIRAVARGRPRRPLVLRSHRGRGKTSALGLAAAGVLADGLGDVLVTAPRRASVEPLFALAASQPGVVTESNGRLHHGDQQLRFIPPDVLLDSLPEARLLLIDEAAALPAPVLEALFQAYPRCVFATTEHGYEGTGRGFAIRFQASLARQAVSVHRLTLTTPIRWAPNDPLEALIDRLLLLDADPVETLPADPAVERVDVTAVDPARLGEDEPRLSELFGLLISAHYRTTPRDLRQLLDVPGSRVWQATLQGHVIATGLTQDEGGLGTALSEAVFNGERRVRGHLLPQTMAAHAGEPDWPALRGRRIQRIAAHAEARRQGLGSRLVQTIAQQARDDGLDFLGVSFGVEDDLLAFWAAQGMRPLHLGHHRDHASGQRAQVMAMGLSDRGRDHVERSARRFQQRLPALAAGPLREADPALLAQLLAQGQSPAGNDLLALVPADRRQVLACAHRQHHLDAALPALRAFLPSGLGHQMVQNTLPLPDRALLVGRFLQLREPEDLATRFDLSGKQAVDTQSRRILRDLLSALEQDTADQSGPDGLA